VHFDWRESQTRDPVRQPHRAVRLSGRHQGGRECVAGHGAHRAAETTVGTGQTAETQVMGKGGASLAALLRAHRASRKTTILFLAK